MGGGGKVSARGTQLGKWGGGGEYVCRARGQGESCGRRRLMLMRKVQGQGREAQLCVAVDRRRWFRCEDGGKKKKVSYWVMG